ncbi:MAG: Asp23/Gls24 family envelope stress response protein [Rhodococcus sp.]|nr:Asp23/Gls24 family envelope stress response protein [Rhodococcus sp. (in: high G+C Gram-positive bacteria)]
MSADDTSEPADVIAAAVLEVPGVAALHGGTFGEVGTYLPGRRVAGVRTDETGTDVHVTVYYDAVVADVAERVRKAVGSITGTKVDVTIADVVPAGSKALDSA